MIDTNAYLSSAWAAQRQTTDATPETEKVAADKLPGVRGVIGDLLLDLARLRVAHWQADTKTNVHAALGSLYETLDGLVDDFAETLMGFEGSRDLPAVTGTVEGGKGHEGVLSSLKALVAKLCDASKKAEADDLCNIAADMLQAVNKAAYLLS